MKRIVPILSFSHFCTFIILPPLIHKPPEHMNNLEAPQNFLHSILEGFIDGILVLTEQQEILYTNTTAQRLLQQLSKSCRTNTMTLPREIWRSCEALIESQDLYPKQQFVIESEVSCEEVTLCIRVQWLTIQASKQPCLLVRLQDHNQATQGLAIAEAQLWGLTHRETEVWQLRRAGLSRKQIAAALYIADDTAKKHLRNIHTKRQIYLDEEEWRSRYGTPARSSIPCTA